jgi:hypothetical protein
MDPLIKNKTIVASKPVQVESSESHFIPPLRASFWAPRRVCKLRLHASGRTTEKISETEFLNCAEMLPIAGILKCKSMRFDSH